MPVEKRWGPACAALACGLLVAAFDLQAGSSKLLATGGVSQLEGAAGGGLTPWALIAGTGTEDEIGATTFATRAGVNDYTLGATGVAVGIYDRVEVSLARHEFRLEGRVLPGNRIRQDVFGLKWRVTGDAVFDQDTWMPQIAVGLQHKRNLDFNFIPATLGARRASGTDLYVSATKLYLGALAGRNLLLNATVRATRANQLGVLGFGGPNRDAYRPFFEGSAALFVTDNIAIGAEYRAKPNNLAAAREDAWKDLFIAWFPSKHLSATLAYTRLGQIAGFAQSGWYLSLQAGF